MKKFEHPKFLWLKHVRQEGLVISKAAITDLDPIGQKADDNESFAQASSDIWKVFTDVLEWPSEFVKRGDSLPPSANCDLVDLGLTLRADASVVDKSGDTLLLVKCLDEGSDPDERGLVPGWEGVTHQQAFDRHLRDGGVEAGLLVTSTHYRLTYSPKGETPGYLEWPIKGMTETDGRAMLAGFKLVLNKMALWGPEHRRLHFILKESREKQNSVSTQLAGQVLEALYTLLRGFTEAADAELATKMEAIADQQPHHFYEGLLTVLLRLVFILFAEDRDLLPSSDNEKARSLYDNGYSIRELFGRLESDAALYPDTMDDRYGAWGRLAGLFKLIHNGTSSEFMHERRGKLFDPKAFPFLTGQFEDEDTSKILPVSDDCIHKVLKCLLLLDGERLSYKTLDVEQIGSVYETVMGFTIERTNGRSIALKSGKANVPAYVNLDRLLEKAGKDRKKYLKDTIDYEVTAAQNKHLKPAQTWQEIVAALDSKIDERGSPAKKPCPIGTIILQPTDERRKTGSHYTPRSLTAPIVEEALEPILIKLGDDATPDEVLNLKICDPAMGSGAFLVEACRALGERLQTAWEKHKHLMPDDAKEDPVIFARREVAKRCIYGVDKNHMATDLAKLSLWLITLSRGEDFTFLDHALKTGDSLVGLSLDKITNVTWTDEKDRPMFASAFIQRVQNSRDERRRIRNAPDNVTYEIQHARMLQADKELEAVRLGGDAIIAAFFAGKKAKERKEILNKLQDQISLGSTSGWAVARAMVEKLGSGTHPIRPFHWEIEFPEVFDGENHGFDSFVGNPPFAGKNTITAGNKIGYLDWLKSVYALGAGFIFDDKKANSGGTHKLERMQNLIDFDSRNQDVIKPYIGASEIFNDPSHSHYRYIIDFGDMPLLSETEPCANDWPQVLDILRTSVKPARDKDKRQSYRDRWWIHAERRPELRSKMVKASTVVTVGSKASVHCCFAIVNSDQVISQNLHVIPVYSHESFAVLSSRLHEAWARSLSASMGDNLAYTPSDCLKNFPFPIESEDSNLFVIGENFNHSRSQILLNSNLGLTKTYNRFHDPHDVEIDIVELRRLHAEMDDAVLRAYGWDDLADICKPGGEAAPQFLHDTAEPEFAYQKRYHWPAWFRDKVLARLLELNKERAAAEKEDAKTAKTSTKRLGPAQAEQKGTLL